MLEREDFDDFCQLMIDSQLSRVNRVFTAGSQAEVEGNEESIKRFCRENTMDVDYMMYSRDAYVFKEYDKVPPDYRGLFIKYMTEGIHPGYVRLLKCDDSEHIFGKIGSYLVDGWNDIEQILELVPLYNRVGPAFNSQPVSTNAKKLKIFNVGLLHAPNACDIDQVLAHHSPYWPGEAAEWITRQRPRGSLLHDVIRRVVVYGCDFVCVSHKGYIQQGKDHEWRFSFSMAELILIKNWSKQQRAVYRTIRILHKFNRKYKVESQLRVYHFKTLMLWAVETKAKCFWEDMRLLDSVCKILMDMMRCLNNKSLPHYFIPTNNLFGHLVSEDIFDLVNALADICIDTALVFNVLTSCQKEEVWNAKRKLFISMPTLLYNNLVAAAHTTNEYLGAGDTLSYSQPDDDLVLLKSELKAVHALIELSSIVKFSDCAIYRDITCEKCTTNKEVEAAYDILRCNKRLCRTIDSLYKRVYFYRQEDSEGEIILSKNGSKPVDIEEPLEQPMCALSKSLTEHTKRVLFFRGGSFKSVNILALKEGSPIFRHTVTNASFDELALNLHEKCTEGFRFINCVKHYKFSPEHSLTVPVFWFIIKAYTANHYLTLLSDYETVVEICDEMINAYNASEGNKWLAEKVFLSSSPHGG